MTRPVRIGTRASALARVQSTAVADRIAATGRTVELVDVTTKGDVDAGPLTAIGGAGVFTSALRDALLAGELDVAVHSLKDLPTAPLDGLVVAAVPTRDDPRDVVVARDGLTLAALPAGSTVGTGAPRRAAQLHALGFGLEVVDVRGNVDTRLAKVAHGDLDAVLLARAGLARLDRLDAATEVLDPMQMLPAPGQGALAVECRADDELVAELRDLLDDPDSRAAVTAERAFLAVVEAGCLAPLGALAERVSVDDETDELWLRGVVVDPSGQPQIRLSATGSPLEPEAVGAKLAAEMLAAGAADLIHAGGAP